MTEPMQTGPERAIVTFRSSTKRWLFGSLAGWGTLVLSLCGVGLVLLAMRHWHNLNYRYTLTSERLLIDVGVFTRRRDEIELYRIKDIVAEYSVLASAQQMATLIITSSDLTTQKAPYVIRDVPDGLAVREQLRSLVIEQQRLRRMRAIDGDLDLH